MAQGELKLDTSTPQGDVQSDGIERNQHGYGEVDGQEL